MEGRLEKAIRDKNFEKCMESIQEMNALTNTSQYMLPQALLNVWEPGSEEANLANPGAAPVGGAATAIALYTLQSKEYLIHGTKMREIRTMLISYLDEGTKAEIIQEGERITTLPLRVMFTRIQASFNRMNPERERELYQILAEKIPPESSFIEGMAKTVDAFRELQTKSLIVSDHDKTKIIEAKISSEEGIWVGRETLQLMWNRENPTRATRTAKRLIEMIKSHDELQPKVKKAGEQFAGAAKAKEGKEETLCITRGEVRRMVEEEIRARDQAERMSQGGGGSNRGGGSSNNNGGGGWKQRNSKSSGGAGGVAPGAGWRNKPKDFFCSSHGWNITHHSQDCMQKLPGHRDAETAEERKVRCPGDRRNNK